jgi:hypothetical protein
MTDLLEKSAAAKLVESLGKFTREDFADMSPHQRAQYRAAYDQAFALVAREEETDWRQWLWRMFPQSFFAEPAAHHCELWEWVWAIELDVKPDDAFVGVWARGGAKSSSAEMAIAALAARKRRKYGLYISSTQEQADDHVGNVASLLESKRIEIAYPELGERAVGKFGNVKGWRRNRLRTADGFTLDALGLDSAARGVKLDSARPDLMCLDDLDGEDDNPARTEKKLLDVTHKLLPAGSSDLAVLAIQNLIIPTGIFARLAGVHPEGADFLAKRQVSGPIPALIDATYEPRAGTDGWDIIYGTPTWEGQNLEACQAYVDTFGLTAFKAECQHDTEARGGGMFDHLDYQHCRIEDVPWNDIVRVAVWCDPAVTTTDNSDSQAVQADGLAANGDFYRLRSYEQRATPVEAIKVAIAFAVRFGTRRVGIETDQGGDTWISVYKEAAEEVRADLAALAAGDTIVGPDIYIQTLVEIDTDELAFPLLHEPAQQKAGTTQQTKAGRAQQMLAQYEAASPRVVHVLGTHSLLERALNRFPVRKPFDLTDAAYWSMADLLKLGQRTKSSARRTSVARLPDMPLRPTGTQQLFAQQRHAQPGPFH